jgi:hypothetical protein
MHISACLQQQDLPFEHDGGIGERIAVVQCSEQIGLEGIRQEL